MFSASCPLPFALLLYSHNTTLSNLPPCHSRRCWELVQPCGIRRNLNIWVCPSLSWKSGSMSTCSCVNSLRLNMQAMQPSARVPTSSLWEEILIMVIMTEEIPLRGTSSCYCVTSEHGKYDRGLGLLPQKKNACIHAKYVCKKLHKMSVSVVWRWHCGILGPFDHTMKAGMTGFRSSSAWAVSVEETTMRDPCEANFPHSLCLWLTRCWATNFFREAKGALTS